MSNSQLVEETLFITFEQLKRLHQHYLQTHWDVNLMKMANVLKLKYAGLASMRIETDALHPLNIEHGRAQFTLTILLKPV
jgi:hypothetical protein